MNEGSSPRIAVAQLGARMHYAVPNILERGEMLDQLYTDICATKDWPRHLHTMVPREWRPSALQRLLDRVPEEVPPEKTTTFPWFGLSRALRGRTQRTLSEKTANYIWAGQRFGQLVTRGLGPGVNGVYAFKTAALEILEWAHAHGCLAMVEQPNVHRPVMHELLTREHELHPNWEEEREGDRYLEKEAKREAKEWEYADLIVCPSEFVRDGIRRSGGPVEKTTVVPYGVDFSPRSEPRTFPDRRLRVLTVGAVGLRKGSPYVLEAASESEATFRIAGSINVSEEARTRLERHIGLLGRVPRSEVKRHYDWADVFLLPSICEGSATVVYEALAQALPVICTPNTGSIVRDGEEGFIIPIRDSDAIVERLTQLRWNSKLYQSMSEQALSRYREEGSLEAYGERLTRSIQDAFR